MVDIIKTWLLVSELKAEKFLPNKKTQYSVNSLLNVIKQTKLT
jgi:hypothetical protein